MQKPWMALVGMVAAALVGLGTGVAEAATVVIDPANPNRILITGTADPTANTMTVEFTANPNEIKVTDTTTDPTTDATCTDNGNNVVCTPGTATVNASASQHNDFMTVIGNIDLTYQGGDGNDTVQGGSADDTVLDGDGDDNLKGGGGADSFIQDEGADTIDGENGGDSIDAVGFVGDVESGDTFRDTGATGLDSISYFNSPSGVDMHIDDGLANDGMTGGTEGDEIEAGFEIISGSGFDDEIFGSAADETLLAGGGEDDVTGGTGVDSLVGGSGVDNLIANDGVADSAIDCGAGAGEIAAIDAIDPAPSGCETI